jgi:hypothetical protein
MNLLSAVLPLLLGSLMSQERSIKQTVWVNDEAWTMVGAKSIENPYRPGLAGLYAIAPVFKTGSDGDYDLVAEGPRSTQNQIEVGGKVLALLPGLRASSANSATRVVSRSGAQITLLYAADTNGDGIVEPLTSAQKVERAIGAGLALPENAEVAFFCTVVLMRTK